MMSLTATPMSKNAKFHALFQKLFLLTLYFFGFLFPSDLFVPRGLVLLG